MHKYLIEKPLNHNVLIVKDENDQEWIVFGRGIGFNKKQFEALDEMLIENKYALLESERLNQYQSLINTTHEDASIMSEWIISEMTKRFGKEYNTYVHISLLDHLNFSLKRLKGNIVINHIFESELQFIYPKEYQFSLEMVDKISKELNIYLPISEVGMITLHIHSALHDEKVSTTALIINTVSKIVNYLEDKYGRVDDDVLKNRLIVHLKFAIKRSIEHISLHNDLNDVIKTKFTESYRVAQEVAMKISNEFLIELDESEVVYLAIHLQNIFHFKGGE